jgi:hypothetical protein
MATRRAGARTPRVRTKRPTPLSTMPPIEIPVAELEIFGREWQRLEGRLGKTAPYHPTALCNLFDRAVGRSLAVMLGGLDLVSPNKNDLTPEHPNCVEVGHFRVVGGVRPQNFDVGYRPDGVRIAFDSKSLNDTDSVQKNSLNMVNDLSAEATTVHSRFPYAVVGLMVIFPIQCAVVERDEPTLQVPKSVTFGPVISSKTGPRREPITPLRYTLYSRVAALVETLERLGRRTSIKDPDYMAEAISLVFWNPLNGTIDPNFPAPTSPLRIENFSSQIERAYRERYKGLPPHAASEE